ncbi:MAG: alpha amylase [Pseudomonadales bacterium]|nr:alpha amylase [Pseudomonadales bacterium]
MKRLTFTLLSAAAIATPSVWAHDWQSSRPDSHAPISVMGDHTHKEGEFMLSYRAMSMNMKGMLDGDEKVSVDDVLTAYKKDGMNAMAPTKMTMHMHMFGGMYASSDKTTWMLMVPYLENNMDMIMRMDMPTTDAMAGMGSMAMMQTMDMDMPMKMNSSGLGDIKVGVLHNILDRDGHKLHLNLALSLPTGSIDEKVNDKVMAYRMQLGSGTYDVLTGATYAAQNSFMGWGAQAIATIRTGENDRDYTLGNRYKVQGWLQKPVLDNLSLSARLAYEDWDNIDGEDSELMMMKMMNPLADPNLQGGQLLSAGIGANLTLPAGNRLAFEYTTEIDQKLDGPQMAFDDSLVLAWQMAF